MDPARPLRDVFTDLIGRDADGPSAPTLQAHGHADLPDELVAEAVGSYADTAPIEVAEHLAPYVMAHSPVPLPDRPEIEEAGWLDALATAPAGPAGDDPDALDDLDLAASSGTSAGAAPDPQTPGIAFGEGGSGDGGSGQHDGLAGEPPAWTTPGSGAYAEDGGDPTLGLDDTTGSGSVGMPGPDQSTDEDGDDGASWLDA